MGYLGHFQEQDKLNEFEKKKIDEMEQQGQSQIENSNNICRECGESISPQLVTCYDCSQMYQNISNILSQMNYQQLKSLWFRFTRENKAPTYADQVRNCLLLLYTKELKELYKSRELLKHLENKI